MCTIQFILASSHWNCLSKTDIATVFIVCPRQCFLCFFLFRKWMVFFWRIKWLKRIMRCSFQLYWVVFLLSSSNWCVRAHLLLRKNVVFIWLFYSVEYNIVKYCILFVVGLGFRAFRWCLDWALHSISFR